jgi:hypothetical protein
MRASAQLPYTLELSPAGLCTIRSNFTQAAAARTAQRSVGVAASTMRYGRLKAVVQLALVALVLCPHHAEARAGLDDFPGTGESPACPYTSCNSSLCVLRTFNSRAEPCWYAAMYACTLGTARRVGTAPTSVELS